MDTQHGTQNVKTQNNLESLVTAAFWDYYTADYFHWSKSLID
jgi:hypothetical protein